MKINAWSIHNTKVLISDSTSSTPDKTSKGLLLNKIKGRGGDGDGDSSEEEAEKRRATQLVYGSSGAVVEKTDQNATAIRQVDTELEKDQR